MPVSLLNVCLVVADGAAGVDQLLSVETGKATATGSGPGQGYTINVPLPGDSGHEAMLAVWQRVVEPAARRFQPDIILCSAGVCALCEW